MCIDLGDLVFGAYALGGLVMGSKLVVHHKNWRERRFFKVWNYWNPTAYDEIGKRWFRITLLYVVLAPVVVVAVSYIPVRCLG